MKFFYLNKLTYKLLIFNYLLYFISFKLICLPILLNMLTPTTSVNSAVSDLVLPSWPIAIYIIIFHIQKLALINKQYMYVQLLHDLVKKNKIKLLYDLYIHIFSPLYYYNYYKRYVIKEKFNFFQAIMN